MGFLGPGSHVACSWDELDPLVDSLREKGLNEGNEVIVRYKDLVGEPYRTRWRVNPLLYAGNRHVPREGPGDVVAALNRLSDTLAREPGTVANNGYGPREARQGTLPG